MKYIVLMLIAALQLRATEARVESMGSNSDFIVDEVSVSQNPATCFTFGNMLVGSLGKVAETGGDWVRGEQWFGGWTVFPLPAKPGLRIGLGATVNKPFDVTKFYSELDNRDFFTVHNKDNRFATPYAQYPGYIDFLEVMNMNDPHGNIYLFSGVSINNNLNIALGGRYAGTNSTAGSDESFLAIQGGNLGLTYGFGSHSVEASVNLDVFKLVKKERIIYRDTNVTPINLDFSENNFDVQLRSFISLSQKNKVVPVMTMVSRNIMGISNTDLGIGAGFNRQLHKGFIWAAAKYVYHTASYPERIGIDLIYPSNASSDSAAPLPADVKEQSHKMVYSFGVEKTMIWDWFTLRVGGNKVYEYLDVTKDDFVLKSGLFERDVDAVAWGITLGTPDQRLRFDVTFSEAFPYSNMLAGGEDGMLLSRISAALKF